MNFFRKKDRDFEFLDKTRMAYNVHPIQKASEVNAHFQQDQLNKFNKFEFAKCPGMIDLKNYGYIVPAWDDIHFIANKSGVLALMGNEKRESKFHKPKTMNANLAQGIFQIEDEVPLTVLHIASPWGIKTYNKNISLLIQAATFHSSFLDNLYIYPGIVDYGKFTEMNLICSPKRKCEFTIKAGEPLLHVLPFEGKQIVAGFGPADDYQKDELDSIYSSAKHFYRKYAMRRKPTKLL